MQLMASALLDICTNMDIQCNYCINPLLLTKLDTIMASI